MDRPASCGLFRLLAFALLAGVLLAASACSGRPPFPKRPQVKESMNPTDAALRGERLAAAAARRGDLPREFASIDVGKREADVLRIMGRPQTISLAKVIDRSLIKHLDDGVASGATSTLEHYFWQLEQAPAQNHKAPTVVTKKYTWKKGSCEVTVIMIRPFQLRYVVTGRNGQQVTADRGENAPNWSDDWVVGQITLEAPRVILETPRGDGGP